MSSSIKFAEGAVVITVVDDEVQVSVAGSQSVGLRIPRKNFARFVQLLYKVQELSEVKL